jgi:hypothetical protein
MSAINCTEWNKHGGNTLPQVPVVTSLGRSDRQPASPSVQVWPVQIPDVRNKERQCGNAQGSSIRTCATTPSGDQTAQNSDGCGGGTSDSNLYVRCGDQWKFNQQRNGIVDDATNGARFGAPVRRETGYTRRKPLDTDQRITTTTVHLRRSSWD